jgi:hypothetical protein
VADLIGLDGRGWLRYLNGLPVDDRYRAYAAALLLAHQQLHGGKARVDALRSALTLPRNARHPPALIAPEAAVATQESLVRYWRPKGLMLEFPAPK